MERLPVLPLILPISTGGASRVVMRGVKSITSSNLALYVIDGVPMYNMMMVAIHKAFFADQPGTMGRLILIRKI